jgi:hypothetical protein
MRRQTVSDTERQRDGDIDIRKDRERQTEEETKQQRDGTVTER